MTALEFVELFTHAIFVAIAVVVIARAVRRPTPANLNVAAFFGIAAFVIVEGRITDALGIEPTAFMRALNAVLVLALPFFLLRLVADFAAVPEWLLRGAFAALIALGVLFLLVAPPRPALLTLAAGLYFIALTAYASIALVGTARRSHGVTRRRLTAAAAGSLFLALAIAAAVVPAVAPDLDDEMEIVTTVLVLVAALCYFVGFAPPQILRRAWQEPELRAFLSRAAELPRLGSTAEIVRELEQGAARSLGALATIGLWLPDEGVLRFIQRSGEPFDVRPGELVAGQIFESQEPRFVLDAAKEDPAHGDVYRSRGAHVVVGAPITAGERRLGVLVVYAERAPIFAQDDLDLTRLLADQAAVVLESRALIDEAARVHAREEAARMKEDFISAAAHDLRTPLTTLVGQAQVLERRAGRNPSLAPELPGIQRIVREAERLRGLVGELLDASRLDRGALVGPTQPADLAAIVADVLAPRAEARKRVRVAAPGPLVVSCDPPRIAQVVENLVDNALKFSAPGGVVRVDVSARDGEAVVAVADEGIGIAASDLPHVFERFFRGGNVDDRQYAGMGLGLYICRGIVEQHGGRIWVESRQGRGATFRFALPLAGVWAAA